MNTADCHCDLQKTAFTCVWLACKLEEHVHSSQINRINVVFERIYARREGLPLSVPDPGTANAVAWNTEINTVYELEMLKSFGFICHIDHPHKLICNLSGFIFIDPSGNFEHSAPTNLTQVRLTTFFTARTGSVECHSINRFVQLSGSSLSISE